MKVGDSVRLKNIACNEVPFLRKYRNKTGKVVAQQRVPNRCASLSYVRVEFLGISYYEDLGAWRLELT